MKLEDLTPREQLALALEDLRHELLNPFRPLVEWLSRRLPCTPS